MSQPFKRLAVFSGKGGTGKTTLSASFAKLSSSRVVADCDVDAANLALLMPGEDEGWRPFYANPKASIGSNCTGCGSCIERCRFDALRLVADLAQVNLLKCEGCRVCAQVCPVDAVQMVDHQAGAWTRRQAQGLVHGALGIAQDNSGKLVAKIREEAEAWAKGAGLELVLIDGPPGIGCPVHAALGRVDLALVVTEPTVSGRSDLERFLDLAQQFQVPTAVAINKWDLAPQQSEALRAACQERGVPILGKIPFDAAIPKALALAQLPLAPPVASATQAAIRSLWHRVQTLLFGAEDKPGVAQ